MKERQRFLFCNIILTILCIAIASYCQGLSNEVNMKIYFDKEYVNQECHAIIYHTVKEGTEAAGDNRGMVVSILLQDIATEQTVIRLKPAETVERFSIEKIRLEFHGIPMCTVTNQELLENIGSLRGYLLEEEDDRLYFVTNDAEASIDLSSDFTVKLLDMREAARFVPFYIGVLVYILFGILQVRIARTDNSVRRQTWKQFFKILLGNIAVCLGILLVYGERYLEREFGAVPLGQLLFHLKTPLEGTNLSSFKSLFLTIAFIILIVSVIVFLLDWCLRRNGKQNMLVWWLVGLGTIFSGRAIISACDHFDVIEYFQYVNETSELYETYYADGREVELTFPEQKRNLIYIFLESMEVTYSDSAMGGALDVNIIPELTELALENGSFSGGQYLNGAYTLSGTTFTMGGLMAQTAGIPVNGMLVSNSDLNNSWESESYFPGVWSIGDILHEAGYNQEFLIGSDGNFAGRSSYFRSHGQYDIFDYYTAIEEGRIAEDYHVWWGYEDAKLFEYAKDELMELAAKEEPFNLTMLTVDTHFTDGYLCELCGADYENQYSNVIACSDRQVAEFVVWIQQQDFYENTTIVIAGDHLTMDSAYMEAMGVNAYDRKAYFTVIHPAQGCDANRSRVYSTLDLYPTTLAALGVEIEGERLGLGVNLYSDESTLLEQYGIEYVNTELIKNSELYRKELLYKE